MARTGGCSRHRALTSSSPLCLRVQNVGWYQPPRTNGSPGDTRFGSYHSLGSDNPPSVVAPTRCQPGQGDGGNPILRQLCQQCQRRASHLAPPEWHSLLVSPPLGSPGGGEGRVQPCCLPACLPCSQPCPSSCLPQAGCFLGHHHSAVQRPEGAAAGDPGHGAMSQHRQLHRGEAARAPPGCERGWQGRVAARSVCSGSVINVGKHSAASGCCHQVPTGLAELPSPRLRLGQALQSPRAAVGTFLSHLLCSALHTPAVTSCPFAPCRPSPRWTR